MHLNAAQERIDTVLRTPYGTSKDHSGIFWVWEGGEKVYGRLPLHTVAGCSSGTSKSVVVIVSSVGNSGSIMYGLFHRWRGLAAENELS